MAKHTLRIDYDGETLTVRHACVHTLAGHAVTHSEPVALADEAGSRAALDALLAANLEEMEGRAEAGAVAHVAAVTGRLKKGQKALTAGGSLGAVGAGETKKGT